MLEGDLAIRGANIITMDPRQPRAEALLVRKGRIIALGGWEQVADRVGGVQTLDLEGKIVLPGFIDTHVHFLWTALGLG
jgi:predicted amidohydrolase YtcJ